MQKIKILYILVGEGGSDLALLTSLQSLKEVVEPYVLVGRLATPATLQMLEEAHIPYEVWRYKFFWFDSGLYPLAKYFQKCKLWWERRRWQKRVMDLVKQHGIQLIHTNTSAYQFGLLAAQALQIPHVWHFREYQTLDFNKQHAFSLHSVRMLSSQPRNYNLAVTKGIYDFYQLPDQQSAVVYDAVCQVPAYPLTVARPYFLYVGRVVEEKGVLELLQAYERYCSQGGTYDLYLIGAASSSMQLQLDRLQRQPLLAEKIKAWGRLSVAEVYGYMQQAKALVVPSPFEAFGLITAEAMFNYCLVIGRDVAGTREQMDNGLVCTGGEIALRFESEDQLLERLQQVSFQDDQAYAAMKDRAYRTVSSLYDVAKNASTLETVYLKLLNETL